MGYAFALVAVACGSIKGFCGKKISTYTEKMMGAAYLNFIRMLICTLISLIIALLTDGEAVFSASFGLIGVAAFSGIMTSVMAISWLFAVRGSAYMLVEVFLTIGGIVPLTLSYVFFDEPISFSGIIGFLILMLAAFVLCSYSSSVKGKIKFSDIVVLCIVSLSNGLMGFSQKIFNHSIEMGAASTFNFYSFVFSAIVFGMFFAIKRESGVPKVITMPAKAYGFVLIMAVCLFGNSFFNTLAAAKLLAYQLYPLSQGCGLIISTIMAALFFGEKVKLRLVIGVLLTFVGVLIMNVI